MGCRKTAWCIVLLAATLFTAGCGGGSKSGGKSLFQQYKNALAEPDKESRASKLVAVAKKQRSAGDIAGAETSLADAVKAASEVEAHFGRASSYMEIAEQYGESGVTSKAKKSLREARRAIDQIEKDLTRVSALSELAVCYGLYLKNMEAARSYLGQAERSVAKLEVPADKVIGHLAIASSYHQLKLAEDSQRTIEAARTTAGSIQDTRARCDAITKVATALGQMKEKEKAKAQFDEAIEAADAIDDPVSKAHALAEVGHALSNAGVKDKAEQVLDRARKVAFDQVTDAGLQNEIFEKINKYLQSL